MFFSFLAAFSILAAVCIRLAPGRRPIQRAKVTPLPIRRSIIARREQP